MLLKTKSYSLENMDGGTVDVVLSRFPATIGREIGAKYPMANLPKIGDYKVSEETMEKLMGFVGVMPKDVNGKLIDGAEPITLKTRALIDNHIPDPETLMKVEMAMLEYNFTFFRKGRISDFFGEFVQMVVGKITEMSIPSSAPSSIPEKPASTNSEPSTT